MSLDISVTTGLPVLPEGEWWEVRRHFDRGGLYVAPMQDGYDVCIVTKKTVPASSKRGKRWWNAPVYVPECVKDAVLFSFQITDPARYANWRPTLTEDWYRHPVGKVIIAPADVIKVAKDIIDHRERQAIREAEIEASTQLLGAYPPKTLTVEHTRPLTTQK